MKKYDYEYDDLEEMYIIFQAGDRTVELAACLERDFAEEVVSALNQQASARIPS